MARPTAALITGATSIAAASTVARMSFRNLNGSPLRSFVPPQRLQIAICVDFRSLWFARSPEKVTAGLRVTSFVNVRQNMIRGAII
jgi:hypothetical protein